MTISEFFRVQLEIRSAVYRPEFPQALFRRIKYNYRFATVKDMEVIVPADFMTRVFIEAPIGMYGCKKVPEWGTKPVGMNELEFDSMEAVIPEWLESCPDKYIADIQLEAVTKSIALKSRKEYSKYLSWLAFLKRIHPKESGSSNEFVRYACSQYIEFNHWEGRNHPVHITPAIYVPERSSELDWFEWEGLSMDAIQNAVNNVK